MKKIWMVGRVAAKADRYGVLEFLMPDGTWKEQRVLEDGCKYAPKGAREWVGLEYDEPAELSEAIREQRELGFSCSAYVRGAAWSGVNPMDEP